MAFSVDRSILNPVNLQELAKGIQKLFTDLEDELNRAPGIQPDVGQGFPRTTLGDLLITQTQGNITFKFVTSENTTVDFTVGPAITNLNSNFLGTKVSGTTPTTSEFPLNGNWGYHNDTVANKIYLAYNLNGTIKKIELT